MMLNKVNQPISAARVAPNSAAVQTKVGGFGSTFQEQLTRARVHEQQGIAFSKHAMARAEERGIEVDDALLDQLSESVEKAQAKGATNILAFDATRAFIVNVPHGRVITAMSQEEMKENIFTNIDGAVIL